VPLRIHSLTRVVYVGSRWTQWRFRSRAITSTLSLELPFQWLA